MSQSKQGASVIDSVVPSPCIDICELDEGSICLGCYRAIEEIAGWGMLDNAEKLEIIELSNKRRNAVR